MNKRDIFVHWVVLNPMEAQILFHLYNWRRRYIFRGPPKTFIFSMQLVLFTVERKSSQTKTFSRNVFFRFCLEHFSLNCIIKKCQLLTQQSP